MAITKNPLIRYKILDKCFRNPGRRYFIDDLISECNKTLFELNNDHPGISRRQILDDISFMESDAGWNIKLERHRDSKKVFYRYEDISYSINNMPLNDVEINQLKSAIQILAQFQGMPQFDWMNELLPKLKQGINTDKQNKMVMSFETNPYLKGIEKLGPLFNAITYEKVLSITYQDFKSPEPYKITIHPHFLKQYNNRWFLFGYNEEKQKGYWNLAVDRIISIEEKNNPFIKSIINWEDFFEDIIGVTKPENALPIKVSLIFNGDTSKYIESKPLHGSQKSVWHEDKTLEVNLELIVNYEFERLILSYGENVKVVYPEFLVESIKRKIANTASLYSKSV